MLQCSNAQAGAVGTLLAYKINVQLCCQDCWPNELSPSVRRQENDQYTSGREWGKKINQMLSCPRHCTGKASICLPRRRHTPVKCRPQSINERWFNRSNCYQTFSKGAAVRCGSRERYVGITATPTCETGSHRKTNIELRTVSKRLNLMEPDSRCEHATYTIFRFHELDGLNAAWTLNPSWK